MQYAIGKIGEEGNGWEGSHGKGTVGRERWEGDGEKGTVGRERVRWKQ